MPHSNVTKINMLSLLKRRRRRKKERK